MKLIVGLGNPGGEYRNSRHNIGSLVIRELAKSDKISFKRESSVFSLCAKGKIEKQNVILASPFTFMNLSGQAVKALLRKYRIILENLLVVCDDLDLEFGRLRLRPFGSAGGHRGLQSIIDVLNCNRFCRLRIGIGRPPPYAEASDYVLAPFTRREKGHIREIIQEAIDCCRLWILKGPTEAMNLFNQRRKYA